MSFIEIVLSLIDENKISKNKLLSDLNLSKNSFVNWTERGTIPNGDTILKIADYFGVSTDYLLGKTDTPTQEQQDEFSVLLNDCSPDERERVKQYIKFIKSQREK